MTHDKTLEQLRSAVDDAARQAPSVSNWSVGMHIHHCCLSMIGICQVLGASSPPPPPRKFSIITSAVFLTGRIPRGRGQAPSVALPADDISPAQLVTLLDESEQKLTEAAQLDPNTWFKHFVFGILGRDKSVRFMQIHNSHHLRIIYDIRSAEPVLL